MPQLDLVTFLPQYVWMTIIFLGFYYGLTKYYLPALARLLALRHHRLQEGAQEAMPASQEHQALTQGTLEHLRRACGASGALHRDSLQHLETWVAQESRALQSQHGRAALGALLESAGESTLRGALRHFHGGAPVPSALALGMLLEKLQRS